MANQLTGRIEVLGQTQQVASKSGSTFNRRELVLNCARYDQYTGEQVSENHPQFEFGGSKCEKLDSYKVGDLVTVSFTLQGTWYDKDGVRRNFTRVVGYDIERKDMTARKEQPVQEEQPVQAIPPVPPMPVNDGLPF